jgi:hypothetical protein
MVTRGALGRRVRRPGSVDQHHLAAQTACLDEPMGRRGVSEGNGRGNAGHQSTRREQLGQPGQLGLIWLHLDDPDLDAAFGRWSRVCPARRSSRFKACDAVSPLRGRVAASAAGTSPGTSANHERSSETTSA